MASDTLLDAKLTEYSLTSEQLGLLMKQSLLEPIAVACFQSSDLLFVCFLRTRRSRRALIAQQED